MADDRKSKKSDGKGAPPPAPDEALVKLVDSLPSPAEFADRVIESVPQASGIKIYLKEIGRCPVLSESEELALVKTCQAKPDPKNRKKLNEANIRLVAWIAKEYAGAGNQLADLINDGTLGLAGAVDSFDPEAGQSFRMHAASYIRKAVSEAVAYETSMSRVPDYLLEKVESIKPVSLRLMNAMGREPTREEVADELGLDPDVLDRLVKLVGHAPGNEEKKGDEEEELEQQEEDFYDPDIDYD